MKPVKKSIKLLIASGCFVLYLLKKAVFRRQGHRKRILIFENTEPAKNLAKHAKAMGLAVHLFSKSRLTKTAACVDHIYKIDFERADGQAEQTAEKIQPVGILVGRQEKLLLLANRIEARIGLNNYPETSVNASVYKHRTREILAENHVSVVRHKVIRDIEEFQTSPLLPFPFVMKPLDSTGSNGAFKIAGPGDLEKGYAYAKKYTTAGAGILVEAYVEGPQYDIEIISFEGNHRILTIVEEYYEDHPPYFPPSWFLFNPDLEIEARDKIVSEIRKALRALHIRGGMSHCELRIDSNGEIKIIDIANRMGFGRQQEKFYYPDLYRMYIESILGEKPRIFESEQDTVLENFQNNNAYLVKYIYNSDDARLLQLFAAQKDIEIISHSKTKSSITREVPYYGSFIAACSTPGPLKQMLAERRTAGRSG